MIPVSCYLVLSALLFFIGVFGFVTRRNLIAMLISIELVLNSADINFAVFNRIELINKSKKKMKKINKSKN